MTATAPGMLGRIQLLEDQVRRLSLTIEVMSRYDTHDQSLVDTRLNDEKPAIGEPALPPCEFALDSDRPEEYYATLGHLTLGIAHDVNNLLNIVLGNCELMGESMPANDPRKEFVATVADLGRQAGEMLHYLTDRADRSDVHRSDRVLLSDLFDKLGRLLPRYVGADRSIAVECQAGALAVPLERMQAIRLVLNLVGNARAATPPGGQIAVSATKCASESVRDGYPDAVPAGEYTLLKVSDSGEGMSDDVLRRIFHMHYTTRGETGSGIGLGVVRGIVRDAGGFIQVESAPGQGSQLRVYLPA